MTFERPGPLIKARIDEIASCWDKHSIVIPSPTPGLVNILPICTMPHPRVPISLPDGTHWTIFRKRAARSNGIRGDHTGNSQTLLYRYLNRLGRKDSILGRCVDRKSGSCLLPYRKACYIFSRSRGLRRENVCCPVSHPNVSVVRQTVLPSQPCLRAGMRLFTALTLQ